MNNIYILHYADIDLEGNLSINCNKFSCLEDAQKEQDTILNSFRKKLGSNNYQFSEEQINLFKGISIRFSPQDIPLKRFICSSEN